MNWKFDIVDLIVAVIIGFFLGCAVRPFLVSLPDLPTQGFSSPSSEASEGAGPKVGPESGLNDTNAGETNSSHPTENQCSLSGQLTRKAAERNGCFGDDFLILLAIRKSENGESGKEFGVKGKAWGTDLETQAAWAAATIVKTRERWERAGRPTDFIEYLADRYVPPEDDPEGNLNFKKNVPFWFRRFKNGNC